MPLVNREQQNIAFNQSENKWKQTPEQHLFEEMSEILSVFFIFPETAGGTPLESAL